MSKKTKRRIAVIIAVLILASAAGFCAWYLYGGAAASGGSASVAKVSYITGLGGGAQTRFAGVVEAQATSEFVLDASRTLDKTYVVAGEEVESGQALFAYDTAELELRLEQMQLDIDRYESDIESTEKQIAILTKQRDATGTTAALKLEYTTQIRKYEAEIKQWEYNLKSKRVEIEKVKDQIDNSVVHSDIDGVVRSISENTGDRNTGYYAESQEPYMIVMATGEFRVRGEIGEQNIRNVQAGMKMTIRSRLDESLVWGGEVEFIDLENPATQGGGVYYGAPSETVMSSRYSFYVTLSSSEGLILGQHVFIEPDTETSRSGIWLFKYYIVRSDGAPYVWAVNTGTDRLEKRLVTLGEYDDETECYQIIGGLTPEDEIAYPSTGLYERQPVTREGFSGAVVSGPVETGAPAQTQAGYDAQPGITPEGAEEPSEPPVGEDGTDDATDDGVTPPPVNTSGPPSSGSNLPSGTPRPSTASELSAYRREREAVTIT